MQCTTRTITHKQDHSPLVLRRGSASTITSNEDQNRVVKGDLMMRRWKTVELAALVVSGTTSGEQ